MVSVIGNMIALICTIVIAGIGMDFSPSFTAVFLVAFLTLTALGELCNYFREKQYGRVLVFLGRLFSVTGAVLVIASVFIYAAGDDWLWYDIPIALAVSLLLHFAIYVLIYRKQGRKMGIGTGIENWALLAAGIFTVFCAIPSTALWPYGFGVLLILAARRLREVKTDSWLPRGVMTLGMLLCSVFLVAPIVF